MQKNFNGVAAKNYENANGLDKTLICTYNHNSKMFNTKGMKRLEENTPFHDSYAKISEREMDWGQYISSKGTKTRFLQEFDIST